MAVLGLSSTQEQKIFLETLKQDFVFRLNTDKKSDVALTGFPKDFFYASKPAFSHVLSQLVNLGIPAKDAFWGTGIDKPKVSIAQEGPLKMKFTVIHVSQSYLREFVQKTGVDFAGKKELFADL